jgi:signal transduction histidine kinase
VNLLVGLVGLILIFSLYITLKKGETERLKSDLETQRLMAMRIETRTSELEGAIEQLTAIDRMKDTFLSTVSHEIRTPLTAIQSYSEVLLARTDAAPEVRAEFLAIINREARRLAILINDLQDLSRLEAGRVALHTTPCALAPLLAEAMETATILARDKRLVLSSDVPSDLPLVQVDPQRVVRVFTNLLGNAVKFSPQGESIHLAARLEGRETRSGGGVAAYVHVSVSDHGGGIDAADLPHVFERFFRGSADATGVQGTGLGLAISKEIIERLGGEIWVESTVGKGSVFHVLLPVSLSPASVAVREDVALASAPSVATVGAVGAPSAAEAAAAAPRRDTATTVAHRSEN